MVFNGKKPACAQCRRKHARCDRGFPSCSQCVQDGIHCPGTFKSSERLFVCYGTQSGPPESTKSKRPSITVARLRSDDSITSHKASGKATANWGQQGEAGPSKAACCKKSIPYQLDEKLANIAIAFAFQKVSRLAGKNVSVLRVEEPLTALYYSQADSSSAVRNAIEADAILKLSSRHKSPELRSEALSHYGKALAQLQRQLQGENRCAGLNELTLTIFMMVKCEMRMQTPQSVANAHAHIQGLRRMLILRDPADLADPAFHELFTCILGHVTQFCIQKQIPMPRFSNGESWVNDRLTATDPLLSLMRVGADLTDLRARTRSALESGEAGEADTSDIIAEAHRVLDSFERWEQNLPVAWQVLDIVPQSDAAAFDTPYRRMSWPHVQRIYRDEQMADVMALAHGYKALAWVIICRCTNIVAGATPPSLQLNAEAQLRIRDCVDDACASVGTFLAGETPSAPHLAILALCTLAAIETTPGCQKIWINEFMELAIARFATQPGPEMMTWRQSMITDRIELAPNGQNILLRM